MKNFALIIILVVFGLAISRFNYRISRVVETAARRLVGTDASVWSMRLVGWALMLVVGAGQSSSSLSCLTTKKAA